MRRDESSGQRLRESGLIHQHRRARQELFLPEGAQNGDLGISDCRRVDPVRNKARPAFQ